MRLFVAVWPPPPAIAELETVLAAVRASAPQLRWTTREQWHLTLAFLGEVADDHMPELQQRLARAAGRHPPLTLRFAGSGRFGGRVLFLALDGDVQALKRLAASAGAAARRVGIAVEDRPYRPHLTLARAAAGGADLRPLVARLATIEGQAWRATTLDLVRSRLGQGPGRRAAYESVTSWPLRGSSRGDAAPERRSASET